jgi:hypothetical protein
MLCCLVRALRYHGVETGVHSVFEIVDSLLAALLRAVQTWRGPDGFIHLWREHEANLASRKAISNLLGDFCGGHEAVAERFKFSFKSARSLGTVHQNAIVKHWNAHKRDCQCDITTMQGGKGRAFQYMAGHQQLELNVGTKHTARFRSGGGRGGGGGSCLTVISLIEKFTVFSLKKHNGQSIIIERSSQIKPSLHPYSMETPHPLHLTLYE